MNHNKSSTSKRRRGTTLVECVVAATVVLASMSMLTTIVVRTGQVNRQLRHHQGALDELMNQMNRLSEIPLEELAEAVTMVQVSETGRELLPSAKLSGEWQSRGIGQQVTLRLQWQEPGREENPLELSRWFFLDPLSPAPLSGEPPAESPASTATSPESSP